MKGIYRFAFLFSSFGPLFFIMAVKTILTRPISNTGLIVFLVLFGFSLAGVVFVVHGLKRTTPQTHTLTDLKPRDTDIFPYLMTYIPSLIFKNVYDPDIGIPLVILYALIFLLYFKLDSPFLNPFLAALGYRIFEARMEKSKSPVILISKGRILTGTESLSLFEVAASNTSIYYYEYIPELNDSSSIR